MIVQNASQSKKCLGLLWSDRLLDRANLKARKRVLVRDLNTIRIIDVCNYISTLRFFRRAIEIGILSIGLDSRLRVSRLTGSAIDSGITLI